jgi:hypothetical protein
MNASDSPYTINSIPEENKIVISGELKLQTVAKYNEIIEFLLESCMTLKDPVILDIRNLTILNSSGIASFGLFIIKIRDSGKKLIIHASKHIHWQVFSLEDFKELDINLEIEFFEMH